MNSDYEKIMVDDTYNIIIHKKNPWPILWTRARKIQLVDQLIDFYSDSDEYEKCKALTKKRNELLQE